MGERIRGLAGEIVGAFDLVDAHPSEVRLECLKYGLSIDRFGCPEHPTSDLVALLEFTPQDSPLFAARFPDDAGWTRENMLLADAVDALRIQIWQKGSGKRRDYPKPIPRPGISAKETKAFGNNPIEQDDMDAFLASRGPAAA